MDTPTTILRTAGGVCLSRVEMLTSENVIVSARLQLSTPYSDRPLVFRDIKAATKAFVNEVKSRPGHSPS